MIDSWDFLICVDGQEKRRDGGQRDSGRGDDETHVDHTRDVVADLEALSDIVTGLDDHS